MFFDLSVPYLDSSSTQTRDLNRLKTIARSFSLGYTAVAYDRPFKGVISDADRCRIPLFSLSRLLEVDPTLPSSVKLHRDRNGVPLSVPFRQYTRVTIAVDRISVGSAFNCKGVLRSYDLVAARPLDQDAFDRACQVSDVDMLALDFPLKFRLKLPMVESAIKRGVYFEIKYSCLIADVHIRRQMLSDARLLVDWTRGKNLIISSYATSLNDIRGPYDITNLSSFLLGLSKERAKASISGNCRSLLANALRKKDYKEAIRIERISSHERFNSESDWFGDRKEWDPISSGVGDLPSLDEILKQFSTVSKLPKNPAIDFVSSTKRFSLKDHVSCAGNNSLVDGEKAADISCPMEPESGNFTAVSSFTNDISFDVMKTVVSPLEIPVPRYESDRVSASNIPTVPAAFEEPTADIAVSNNETMEISVQNNVVSSASKISTPDTSQKYCTVIDKDRLVPTNAYVTSTLSSDKISAMHVEDAMSSGMPALASVAIGTPWEVKEFTDNSSSAQDGHLSSKGSETSSTRCSGRGSPEQQTKSNAVDREQKDEVLKKVASMPMNSVLEPPKRGEKEEEYLLSNDVFSKDHFSEVEVHDEKVLIGTDDCMEDILVIPEDHNLHGSTVAEGCLSCKLKSGKRRRKGGPYTAYPFPFKGLLKPILFKKKSCHSRRPSRHCKDGF